MVNSRNIIIFLIVPVVIMVLTVINAHVVAEKYLGQELGLAQYNAVINSKIKNLRVTAGQRKEIEVYIRNEGSMTWLSNTDKGIYLSYHIFNETGDLQLYEGERTALPEALKPGERVELAFNLKAPSEAGNYLLVLDMVHEGVTWFEDVGSAVYIIELEVAK